MDGDGIGSYLYIIVFVVIIVFNILKNLNKQRTVVVPDFSGNQPESREEEFLENPFPSVRKEPSFQVQQVQSKPKNVETIFPKNEQKKKQTDVLKEKEEDNSSVSIAFNNTDDARQAFIYSEIWNRKY